MLEEIQMPVPLALRIVNGMEAFQSRIAKSATRNEIDLNRQGLLDTI